MDEKNGTTVRVKQQKAVLSYNMHNVLHPLVNQN